MLKPTKQVRMRPSLAQAATHPLRAVKTAHAIVTAVSVARARTAVTAQTAVAMRPMDETLQRPNKTLHPHRQLLWR